ncbi:LytTR family DNA-binding domain-containing protein [Rhodovulum marinum]|uniref:LytTR family transcriptional regulator n=1 Tax=Rhodovulum marinum TaxID=320662 RepID=A0A4R2PZX5_9RHOB|nr:LytTR family DNA-binding domain-containing protein [Rhodovulum marinum]TCP41727.1 LytTR family transcriptional regulator [Rhodovulum marinum]
MFEDFNRVLFHPSTVLLWLGLSLLLALSGPFGTYAAPLLDRMAAWPLLVGAGLAGGVALRVGLRRHLPGLGPWPRAAVKAGVLAVVFAPFALRLTAGMGPAEAQRAGAIALAEAALVIFLLSLGLCALRAILVPRATPVAGSEPALMARLPAGRRGPLIRLSSSDHYVRVVTEKGSSDVLIRFADAIAELDGAEGLRVHRSHWVAARAVIGARTENGRLFLRLCDGSEVPVSRRYRPEVEARGLGLRA